MLSTPVYRTVFRKFNKTLLEYYLLIEAGYIAIFRYFIYSLIVALNLYKQLIIISFKLEDLNFLMYT